MKFWDFDYMGRTEKRQEEARNKALRAQKEQLELEAKKIKHEAIERWMEEAASMKAFPPIIHTTASAGPSTSISSYPPYSRTVLGVELDAIMEAKRLFHALGLEFNKENVRYLTEEVQKL